MDLFKVTTMSIITTNPDLPNPATYERETLRFLQEFKFDGKKPSLAHITAIARYFSRLPYENISKIIKRENTEPQEWLRLPNEVTEDHFRWHAGGTCFSLTYFLTGIYTLLGYQAQPLICNLNWGENNHSAVRLSFTGQYFLIDPGYMIFKPLPIKEQNIQSPISAETGVSLRYDESQGNYAISTFRKGNYTRRYQFEDRAIPFPQFAKYWQESFQQPGMDDLTLTRVNGYEMLFIQGDFIKITSPEKVKKMRALNEAEKLIRSDFGIPLDKVEEARKLVRQHSS